MASDGLLSLEADSRSGMRQVKRHGELRFFVDKDDAMEESAFLVGKRDGELPSVTAARRPPRSLHGKQDLQDGHRRQ